MNYLEEKIQREGEVRQGNILKIDHFLNHQIDIDVMRHIAEDFNQKGGRELRSEGYRLESLVVIEDLDYESQTIRFREQ